MKNVFEHIEHVKGKPHHIRKRFAFAAAGGATALIAFVWMTGSLASGAFAIQGSSFADNSRQPAVVTADTARTNANLAGAAAALPPSSVNTPARIEIVDTATSSKRQAEQTIIPF